jgi:hypothetical protein
MGDIGKLKRVLEVLPAESPEAERTEEHHSSPREETVPPALPLKDRAHE